MNRIRLIANRETNFIFHMLSVAQCGYDNAYGQKYRTDYPGQALETLKRHEQLMTVRGGAHCGALYGLLVCLPAEGRESAKAFYQEIVRQASAGEAPAYYVDNGLDKPAREIAEAMASCYDHYVQSIWPQDQAMLAAYIEKVMPLFESSGFTDRAEAAVGCALPSECFYATMVASIENGPEAIDISKDQDVFGIARAPEDALYFIGHEYIIYLLKHALKDEDAFHRFETWPVTEGLAEYYLKKVMGSTRFFHEQQRYVSFFEACESKGSHTTAVLYRMGLNMN